LLLKVKFHKLSVKLGFTIPTNVFDEGLWIVHYGSIAVNPKCKVGKNCRIYSNVVIGANNLKSPVIGDNCIIGAGAVVIGDIEIANNVTIGANSVVNKSILIDGAIVAGAPAKVIEIRE